MKKKEFWTLGLLDLKVYSSPFEGGLRYDDSDEYQAPSEWMIISELIFVFELNILSIMSCPEIGLHKT